MVESIESQITILDGATGTELDRRGFNVSLPLWSARVLMEKPEAVEDIHIDYLDAGAGAVITNTFRTHRRSLDKAGIGDRAKELTTLAVDVARSARDRVKPEALILGSVAPLEDCYRPDLSPDSETCKAEHAEMITHLLDAGVDFVLIETANTRHEAIAAAKVAQRLAPGRWMISFCTKTDGPPGVLLHGASLVDVEPMLETAYAVGINCVPAPAITPQLELLRAVLPDRVHIIAYGNCGPSNPDGTWSGAEAIDDERYADYAEEWIAAGANLIGGCCGTTPETIRAIANRIGVRSAFGGSESDQIKR